MINKLNECEMRYSVLNIQNTKYNIILNIKILIEAHLLSYKQFIILLLLSSPNIKCLLHLI